MYLPNLVKTLQVCDGVMDCDDLSDECLCMKDFFSSTNSTKNPICSHICAPGSLATNIGKQVTCEICEIGEFQCSSPMFSGTSNLSESLLISQNSTCLGLHRVCDGVPDCPKGEDELFCTKAVMCSSKV